MHDSNFLYYIKDWLLSDAEFAGLFDMSTRDYEPFFPAQQFPESEFPYVRYTTTESTSGEMPWWHRGEAILFLWFEDIDKAQQAVNIITDMCGYADESAGELERWLRSNKPECPYHYYSIEVPSTGEIDTTGERGGAHAYAVMIRAQFSRKVQRNRYS